MAWQVVLRHVARHRTYVPITVKRVGVRVRGETIGGMAGAATVWPRTPDLPPVRTLDFGPTFRPSASPERDFFGRTAPTRAVRSDAAALCCMHEANDDHAA